MSNTRAAVYGLELALSIVVASQSLIARADEIIEK